MGFLSKIKIYDTRNPHINPHKCADIEIHGRKEMRSEDAIDHVTFFVSILDLISFGKEIIKATKLHKSQKIAQDAHALSE